MLKQSYLAFVIASLERRGNPYGGSVTRSTKAKTEKTPTLAR
jgi:hypothetical protein